MTVCFLQSCKILVASLFKQPLNRRLGLDGIEGGFTHDGRKQRKPDGCNSDFRG
ncbi:hypothetical protein BBO01nite_09430 [Brevibacillus borstelensis]|nr:hypothetical protein BBO01nite_09430 [Brevibacillus borstelensis]